MPPRIRPHCGRSDARETASQGEAGFLVQEVALEEVRTGRRTNSDSTCFCSECLPAEVGM